MADKEGFLHRWSARKAEARNGAPAPEPVEAEEPAPPGEPEITPEPEPAPDLPDVETLDASSDYTAFLGSNVPQDIANMALRKLWRSDPVLANLDGLNDYDEDFSKVGMASEVVKTLYKVGKGFMAADDEPEKEAVSEDDDLVEVATTELPDETDTDTDSDSDTLEEGKKASDVSDNTPSPNGEGVE